MAKQLFKNGEQISGSGVVVNSNTDVVTTTGAETVSDGTDTLNVVTRDTVQTITGQKTFDNNLVMGSNIVQTSLETSHSIFYRTDTGITYGTITGAHEADGSFLDSLVTIGVGPDAEIQAHHRFFANSMSSPGISFAAAGPNNAADASRILDDYEQATWTPEFTNFVADDGTSVPTVTHASYAKTGRQVVLHGAVNLPATSSTNNAFITGLPYASLALSGSTIFPGSFVSLLLADDEISGVSVVSSNDVAFYNPDTGIIATWADIRGTSTGRINRLQFSITYETLA